MSKIKRVFGIVVFLSLVAFVSLNESGESKAGIRRNNLGEAGIKVEEIYGKLPLYFIQNNGQVAEEVKFYERGGSHCTYFTEEGVYFALADGHEGSNGEVMMKGMNKLEKLNKAVSKQQKFHWFKLGFVNANKSPRVMGEDVQMGKVNYFIGNDPKKWRTDIPTYKSVLYKDVWDGIDLRFYGNNSQLEYDIIAKPGSNPKKIEFFIEGANKLKVDDEGDLEIEINGKKIIQKRPTIYQIIAGEKINVSGNFKIKGPTNKLNEIETISFDSKSIGQASTFESLPPSSALTYCVELGDYNENNILFIDPVFVYSTYLGGSSDDRCNGIAVDRSGNVYMIGWTSSIDFPTASAIQQNNGGLDDVFVTKFKYSGNELIYSTYLGGSSNDFGSDIAVDGSGNAYITGSTYSSDFPTVNPIQEYSGAGHDLFVAKLSAGGGTIFYSTYLGGNGEDLARSIALDSASNAYIAGSTDSTDFPTVSYIQGNLAGCQDAFVCKINYSGNELVYSTYLGGSGYDAANAIVVSNLGNAFITGITDSTDFPTVSPIQEENAGGTDAFVTKLSASGNSLVYSTYLGGSPGDQVYDYGNGIAIDDLGNVYITGTTFSYDFPTVSAYQGDYAGHGDAFLTKINVLGNSIVYSTYLGGSTGEEGFDVVVDNYGNALLIGVTDSLDFPTVAAIQPTIGGITDVFVTKINSSGNGLVFSTFIGGSGEDYGFSLAVDILGNIYLTGRTMSTDFPLILPLQNTNAGENDAFLIKISLPSRAMVCSADFNGDGFADRAIFRPADGMWYVQGVLAAQWGANGDVPVAGYFDGDSLADIAVWRPSDGIWYIKNIITQQWGTREDIPVPGNYGGDLRTDFAVWRPSNGMWYIKTAEGSVSAVQWGASGDIPVPGNYGGDARTDFAVWRPYNGIWYIRTAEGSFSSVQWGTWGDIPVPGDYNGDGFTEIAVFRPSSGIWYIYGGSSIAWGTMGDIPVPGNYGGDSRIDFAVWRPSEGMWYIRTAEGIISAFQWGICSDLPLAISK